MIEKLRAVTALLARAVAHPRAALYGLRERGIRHIVRAVVRSDPATIRGMTRDLEFRSQPATIEALSAFFPDFRFAEIDSAHYTLSLPSGETFLVRRARGWQDAGVIHETFVVGAYADHPSVDGKTVLDIGANIGDTAVYFAKRGAHVIAYEPDSQMCALARRNAELNAVRVDFVNAGVGAASETLLLSTSPDGADTMSVTRFPATRPLNRLHTRSVPVRIVKFGDVLADLGSVFLLKLDCEGCEYPALRALSHDALRTIDHIVMEYHAHGGELAEMLRAAGFAVRLDGDMYMYADRLPAQSEIPA
jgi:FkbM family methyltransferase